MGRGSGRPGGGRAAARVGLGIFVSRIFGFVRDRVFAHYFGSGDLADAWRAALRMPNVVQNLLGEGTLSASFVPVYASLLEEGREEDAARFAGAALGILAVLAGALTLLGIVLAPVLVGLFLFRWDPEKQALTVTLVRILFPMTGVLVISAWALGILNSHRRFFVSYVAPALWNAAMIAAMLGGAIHLGLQGRDLVLALAWGALVGGVLQLGAQIPFLMGRLRGMRLSLGRGVRGVREAIGSFGPVVAARGVVNISGWIDLVLAAQLTTGAVAVLGYAQTFYLLPISLFAMSVAAAELPELSRLRGAEARALSERVSEALRRVAFFVVPSTVAYLALGDVMVSALYETGAFGEVETFVTWAVLAGYTLGLPATTSSRVLSSAFYALHDTHTPARAAYLRVALSVLVGVGAMIPLDRVGFSGLHLGAAGLALGASAGAWLEFGLLRQALVRAIGDHGPGAGGMHRLTLAAVIAAALGVVVQRVLVAEPPVLVAVATLLPFGGAYLAATRLLGVGWPGRGTVAR